MPRKRTTQSKPAQERPGPTAPALRGDVELTVEGKPLKLSRLDKVLYPKTGFTKGQVIDYYIRIAPVLLPHLRDRPLTLKRYPNGVEGEFFYEKRCPAYRPSWMKTTSMSSEQGEIRFCLANDLPSLVWAANLADLELHPYLSRSGADDVPTMMVFDLDPGPPATILECAEVAFLLRKALEGADLESFPKTSGSKGIQLYVPLNTKTTFDQTKAFARQLAEDLARQRPDLIVSKMDKRLRNGKVLIDWSQNDRHKTTVCVYSLRAKEEPTVSTPITWAELKKACQTGQSDALRFLPNQVLSRVDQHGDLFEPVLRVKQKLTANRLVQAKSVSP